MTLAPTVAWLDVRDAALAATRRGWPVTPGTFLGADRRWHGRHDAPELRPIEDTWADTVVTDPTQAQEIWTQAPYSVLLVCGAPVSVLELPYRFIPWLTALQWSGAPVTPVAVTGSCPPRFLVLTTGDSDALAPELAQAGVLAHGAGAWVALPPTSTGIVLRQRWWAAPCEGQTWLPRAEWVRSLLTCLLQFDPQESS